MEAADKGHQHVGGQSLIIHWHWV